MIFFRRNAIKEAIDANLDADFSVFACGANAPNEAVICAFETQLGYSLPKDFRKFSMSEYGGIYIEVKEAFWPKAKPLEVGPFWSFLRGMMTYGFANDVPDWLDMRKQTEEFQKHTGTRLAPFLKIIGDADVYCFDERAVIRRWDHETGEAQIVEKSFEVVFAEELAELKKRKEKKKAGAKNI